MYRVLYRKWRPKVFADVIGQPQVTKTLSSQIREDRLAHAYLFTGSRGTGKTTCAKIFSKAVNCLHPVNGDPCNECEICRGIDNGSVLDIVEIDAASNRGIDDIRALRDEVNFTPSQAKYRVYIIDEVHMLTIEAFNALLKTLEEPPEHVKFILATTEVHKLPSTILSRCQRFDFRRIEPSAIAERLIEIAHAENAELELDAAMLIARIADGGMRDALSLLDRALSVSLNVTTDVISASAGLMNREYIFTLMDAIADRDTAKCLSVLDELHKASCDTERLCTELLDRFRSFLIIKTVERPGDLLVCTDEELDRIRRSSDRFTEEEVLYALRVLTAASEAIRKTQNRRIEAEMAMIRLCRPDTDNGTEALAARIAALEKEIAQLKKNGVAAAGVSARPAVTSPAPPPDIPAAPDVPKKEFAGFAAEKKTTGFAEQFAQMAEEETDDEPFDFDAFMQEHSNGKPQTATNGNTAPSENDGDTDPEEDDVFPFGDDDAPPEEGEGMSLPFDAPEPKPKTAVYEPSEGTPIDAGTWTKIILTTERAFPPLIGALTNSAARIAGKTIFIRFGEKNLSVFVNESILSQYVRKAAAQVLNEEYNIKIEK